MPGRKIRLTTGSSLIIIGTSLTNPTSKTTKGIRYSNLGLRIHNHMLIMYLEDECYIKTCQRTCCFRVARSKYEVTQKIVCRNWHH